MNWSMFTADRATHLKVAVVGLSAALLISVIGITGQQLDLGTDIMTAQGPTVIKAGAPVIFMRTMRPDISPMRFVGVPQSAVATQSNAR